MKIIGSWAWYNAEGGEHEEGNELALFEVDGKLLGCWENYAGLIEDGGHRVAIEAAKNKGNKIEVKRGEGDWVYGIFNSKHSVLTMAGVEFPMKKNIHKWSIEQMYASEIWKAYKKILPKIRCD